MIRFLLVPLVLGALLPTAGLAQGCRDKVKMSCAEGMIWDDRNQTCTPEPSA